MATSQSQPLYKIPESVLVVIHTADLRVLLIERADEDGLATGYWQSVTGSLDTADEPLQETCRREVWEETGIDTTQPGRVLTDWHLHNIYDIYPRWQYRYAPGVTRNTEHVFSLCVPDNIRVVLNPREHVAYQWLPYLDAADTCSSASNGEALLLLPQFFARLRSHLLPK